MMRAQPMSPHRTHGTRVRGTAVAEGWSTLAAALDRAEAAITVPACLLSVAITRCGAPADCDVAVLVNGSCRRIMHLAAGYRLQLHVPVGARVRLVCVRHDTMACTLDLQAGPSGSRHAIALTPRHPAVHRAIAVVAGT